MCRNHHASPRLPSVCCLLPLSSRHWDQDMASSLLEECTPLKRKYDACFNAWFEDYLEPAVSASITPEQRTRFSQEKAAEYEQQCGKIWKQYKDCVSVSFFNCFMNVLSFRLLRHRCVESSEGQRSQYATRPSEKREPAQRTSNDLKIR